MKLKVRKLVFGATCLALVLSPGIPLLHTSASEDTASAWLGSNQPTFKVLEDGVASVPEKYGSTGNQDCIKQTVIIKSTYKLFGTTLSPAVTYKDCSVQTSYGSVNGRYLTRPGTNLAGKIYSLPGEIEIAPLAIPNSNKFIFSDNGGTRLRVMENVDGYLASVPFDHQVKHFIGGTNDSKIIKDQAGNNLEIRNAVFTPDGKWMIGESRSYGIYRLDLDTYKLTFFQKPFDYNSGPDPMPRIAISGDGRYAVVASAGQPTFKLYDLNTCVKKLSVNAVEDCEHRDLLSFVQSKATSYRGVSAIRFSDQNTLTMYLHHRDSAGALKISYISLVAPGHTPVYYNYLGLGDSFASGEGAYEYRHGTDVKDPFNKCHLSNVSYPYLISSRMNLSTYQSIACSGATQKDVIFPDTNTYNTEERQSTGREITDDSEIFDNFLVGYRTQIRFVEKYKPSVVTLSVGGNDIGFSSIVTRCVSADTCYGLPEERWALAQKINAQFDPLVTLYGQLQKQSAPGAKIYVVGYPSMAKADGNCAANVHANAQELKFFNDLVTYLNFVIKQATLRAGVSYIDAETAFAGNRLCETVSNTVAINGLTAGNDKFLDIGPIGKESFHPNRLGHSLFKDRILQATNQFTLNNPTPNSAIPNPDFASAVNFVGVTLPPLTKYYTDDDNMIDGLIYHNGASRVQTDGFAPGSQVTIEAHSNPVTIGLFTASSTGILDATITIPSSLSPGFHEIHALGKNIAGEDMDVQKLVYVAVSENDYDGDGIPNESEKCLVVEPANVDYDKDGMDDACDGQITEPPPDPPVPPIQEQPQANDPEDFPPNPQPAVPLPGDIPVGLPDFVTFPNKTSQSAGETVAGNEEEMSDSSDKSDLITQPIVTSSTVSPLQPPQTPVRLAALSSNDIPQALGASNNNPSVAQPETKPQQLPIDTLAVTHKSKPKPASYLYMLALLFAAILGGVIQYQKKHGKTR